MYRIAIKRCLDFILALLGLLIVSPIMLCVMVLLYFANRGAGIFFFQQRPGKDEKIFRVIKFKTMTDERDKKGQLLPDPDRITPIGAFIRSTSLDELPQLINVLKGDMSLIGPRPLLVEYLPLYNSIQRKRHLVRPGLTGWAQVNGRNTISWKEKFAYDVWYVENLSFRLDLKILFLTIKKVIKKEGINESMIIPMSKFTGNE